MDENRLPELRYPDLTPTKAVSEMPVISADMYQHVGRFAGALVLTAFHQIGGMERFSQWADDNPTDFYTKLFGKTIQRSQQVDHSGSVTLDDAISRLENQPILLGEYTETYDL